MIRLNVGMARKSNKRPRVSRKLPHDVQALYPNERLFYCVGKIAVEWQRLIEALEHGLQLNSGEADHRVFSYLLATWLGIVRQYNVIDDNEIVLLGNTATSYHLLRDALVHGSPRNDETVRLTDRVEKLVAFRLKTKKSYYKQFKKRSLARYLGEGRAAYYKQMTKMIDEEHAVYSFYYTLKDIEKVAAYDLDDLTVRVVHINHLVRRQTNMPLAGPSPFTAILDSYKLPAKIEQVTNIVPKTAEDYEQEERERMACLS